MPRGVYVRSEEYKADFAKRMKGKIPWIKGRKMGPPSAEVRLKKRLINLARGIKPPVAKGVDHYLWKGQNASYGVKHRWARIHSALEVSGTKC